MGLSLFCQCVILIRVFLQVTGDGLELAGQFLGREDVLLALEPGDQSGHIRYGQGFAKHLPGRFGQLMRFVDDDGAAVRHQAGDARVSVYGVCEKEIVIAYLDDIFGGAAVPHKPLVAAVGEMAVAHARYAHLVAVICGEMSNVIQVKVCFERQQRALIPLVLFLQVGFGEAL